jgi:hypothetical protein
LKRCPRLQSAMIVFSKTEPTDLIIPASWLP